MLDVQRLDLIDYLTLRRDAFIYKLSGSEAGDEYLYNAWRLQQTAPDKDALRKKYNK